MQRRLNRRDNHDIFMIRQLIENGQALRHDVAERRGVFVRRDIPLGIEVNVFRRDRQQADFLEKGQVFEEFFGAFLRRRDEQARRGGFPANQRGGVGFRRSP